MLKKKTMSDKLKYEEAIIQGLKTVFDPEIPVNVYDLGLIYKIEVLDSMDVEVEMTLTAPGCPVADYILNEVKEKVEMVPDIKTCTVNLVFEPAWDKDMMSEAAQLELGML